MCVVCACMCYTQVKGEHQGSSSITLHLILCDRISLNQELTSSARWAGQHAQMLALEIPSLPPRYRDPIACHDAWIFMWVHGIRTQTLIFVWQCFTM